jgi:hypothetical protein
LRCFVLAILVGTLSLGCGDDSSSGNADAGIDDGGITATERSALTIGSVTGCAIDEDCALGLYCFQGHCSYDCQDTDECNSGETCSARGECVTGGSGSDSENAIGTSQSALEDAEPAINVLNNPERVFYVDPGQKTISLVLELDGFPPNKEIAFTIDRTDTGTKSDEFPPASKTKRAVVEMDDKTKVITTEITIPVSFDEKDTEGDEGEMTPVSLVVNTSVGSFKLVIMQKPPFAGHYSGTASAGVFGKVGLPLEFQIVTSPDDASLADADEAWLLLYVSDGSLFSPVENYENSPEYIGSKLVYDDFLEQWVSTFENEFVLSSSAILTSSKQGQIGRVLRFEIEPFGVDQVIGRFSDRWEGFYDARSDKGIVELVDVIFEGDIEMTRTGIAIAFEDLLEPPDLPQANPGQIPLPPTDLCNSGSLFPDDCGAIANNTLFENAANADQTTCALAAAEEAMSGETTGGMLSAFLDDSIENPDGMSFAEFMDACAKGTDGICVPSDQILCSRQLLGHAYQNQADDTDSSSDLVVAYQDVTQEAFLGRQLAAFKTDFDTRLDWLKTSDYPAIVTNAVKDLIGQLLEEWQTGVLDVHMGVLGGYFDPAGLAVLTRTTTDDDATEARKRLLSEMIQSWRGTSESLTLAAARWDQLFQEKDERDEKSRFVTGQMFDLYLMAGILTNLSKDSGSGYQATAFGNGFSQLMRRAGALSLSFDDKVFSRDAEVVVSTSLNTEDQEDQNDSLLADLQEEATMEIGRASDSVQTVLAEAEASALDATQLNNEMNNKISELRTELVSLCGLPIGCTASDFTTNEECRVKTSAGDCGFLVEKGSNTLLGLDPSKVGVSEAGQAILTFFDSASSVQIANEEVRAFNARMTLELASLDSFALEIQRWNTMRGEGLSDLETLFADQGVFATDSMNELRTTLTAKAAKRQEQIDRMESNIKSWRGARISGAVLDLAGVTAAAVAHGVGDSLVLAGDSVMDYASAAAEAIPTGTDDAAAPLKGAALLAGAGTKTGLHIGGLVSHKIGEGLELAVTYNQTIREAVLVELQETAAKDDAITESDIAKLEEELDLAIAENDDQIGALQEAYDIAKLQLENELAYYRDMEEFRQRRTAYLQMLQESAGLQLRVERARINYLQRINAYLGVVQNAELQIGRLSDLEGQRGDINRLIGSPGVVFAKANKLAQAESRLQRAKDKLMDWLVGLEYYAVRPFMDQRVQILLAVNPYQLEDISEELKRLEKTCGGAQNKATKIISVRSDLMNITSPILDETTNEEITVEERFRKILAEGYVPIDKRVRYTTDATVGDLMKDDTSVLSSIFDINLSDFANLASTCNAKVISIAVQLVGELGDGSPTVTILYDGTSKLRSCQPGIEEYVDLIGPEITNFGLITMLRTPGRSISPVAGLNEWKDAEEANATLGGLPLASQYTVLINTKIGENALIDWTNLEDILINVEYGYQDVFPVGQCE